jgi:N-acetylglucosaminyldiphosphoundecaprenol N-acetyl-beta-D-mannosaminyltransferase
MTTDKQVLLFGLPISAFTMGDVLERCRSALRERDTLLIGVVNAAKIVNLTRDVELRRSLLECDLIVADGMGVVWASKLLGRPLPARVPGIDLFERLLLMAADEGHSVYLLGAQQQTLDLLQARLRQQLPKLRIAGARDGYFSDQQAPEVAEEIAASGADMLFLGITSPKKEIFLRTHGPTLAVPVLHGVGGSFDIFAGVTKRAPRLWQRVGMEWAFRVVQEPRRLWRRYLTTNTRFVLMTIRERIRPRPEYSDTVLPRGSGTSR